MTWPLPARCCIGDRDLVKVNTQADEDHERDDGAPIDAQKNTDGENKKGQRDRVGERAASRTVQGSGESRQYRRRPIRTQS